ncbi:HI1506-related protein [Brevibacillus sp. SYSU BS000544]|uniref:HI1506-related protein n=1 Tax=Brevibacillus sp. SYSU BS000544 TaxID=3416443 RepID=UPI003CE5699C
MSKGIAITSKVNGFRRAGVQHPAQRVVYPADRFTDLQLKLLEEEPMLIVEEVSEESMDLENIPPLEPTPEQTKTTGKGGRSKEKDKEE